MKCLTPQEAKDLGYKSISTDLDPTVSDNEVPSDLMIRKNQEAQKSKRISNREYLANCHHMYELLNGASDSEIIESMSRSMKGVNAAFIVFSPTKWQLARHRTEIITYENQPD